MVVVFDAMMSGLPTHKEDFAGYSFSEPKLLTALIFLEILIFRFY